MKVLHVIDSLGVGGGAEHSLAAMVPLLRERGVESTIATFRPRGFGLEVALADQGFPVEILGWSRWPGRVRALRRKVRAEHPDLVHASLFTSSMASRLATIGLGVPVINTLASTTYDPSRTAGIGAAPWKVGLIRFVDSITARRLVDRVHAVSQTVRTEATEVLRIDPARICVIPRGRSRAALGEPSSDRRAEVRARLGIDESTTVILHVGRQDHPKGQVTLIQAFAELHERRPGCILLLAGREGDASTEIHAALEASGLGDAVRLLGHRDDIADLCCAADLFVFPSLYEGMPGSILEALALATPVVGSDADSVVEVLEGGRLGPTPPRGDSGALARAMADLLDDPERLDDLAARGRETFDRCYEIDAVAEAMVALYREVVAAGRRRR